MSAWDELFESSGELPTAGGAAGASSCPGTVVEVGTGTGVGLPDPATLQRTALRRTVGRAVGAFTSSVVGSGPGQEAAARLPEVALRATTVRLDRHRLDAYRHLIGESAAGTSGEEAPPGFVHASLFGMQLAYLTRHDFPLPVLGLVHVANRVEQRSAVTPADSLEVTTWGRHLALRPLGASDDPVGPGGTPRAGTQLELVTEVRRDGAVVWKGASTYLARSVALRGLPVLERPTREPFLSPVPSGGWSTSVATTREYAEVSGDHNPIHTNALVARASGFPRRIAHGMDTAARALAILGVARGTAFSWSVDFASPVLVPGRVAVRVAPAAQTAAVTARASAVGATRAWDLVVWDPKRGRLHAASRVVADPA